MSEHNPDPLISDGFAPQLPPMEFTGKEWFSVPAPEAMKPQTRKGGYETCAFCGKKSYEHHAQSKQCPGKAWLESTFSPSLSHPAVEAAHPKTRMREESDHWHISFGKGTCVNIHKDGEVVAAYKEGGIDFVHKLGAIRLKHART